MVREWSDMTESKLPFPSRYRGRPIGDNAILDTLRDMGFAKEQMSGHGFRRMASLG